jgi:ankyrin repeat protein
VNETAADGNSGLVIATHSGQRALAEFLLEKGADPNADGAGYSALHAAVLRGDVELAKVLLSRGANPNATVLKATPMRRNSIDVYIHASLVGATPMVLAAKYADVEMIRILAAGGSKLETPGRDGASPLIVAVNANRQGQPGDLGAVPEPGALEAVKALLDLGSNVNAVNRTGDTALHVATTKGFNKIVQLLVQRGAKLDTKNDRGQTPLAIASARPQLKDTADLLRKLGSAN